LKNVGNETISEAMKNTFFWFDILNPSKDEINVLSDVIIHDIIIYYFN